MRILHITATHLNPSGGIPVVLENLVSEQNKIRNIDSRVLSINYSTENFENSFFYYFGNFQEDIDFISGFQPDVVIFHGIYFLVYKKYSQFIRKNDIDYFIEPHGSLSIEAQKKSSFKKKVVNYTVLKSYLDNSKGMIFLNESERKNSVFQSENDLIIPNGIKDIEEKEFSNNDLVNIVFLGRIDINHKGLDYLFKELQLIDKPNPKFRLSLYGNADIKAKKKIEMEIKKIRYISVNYYGSVYGKDKIKAYKESDIYILTSRYEGFPMTILEALSCGLPCIVTKGTNFYNEIIDNKIGWGADFDNIGDVIETAVEDYIQNKEKYKNNTQKYVLENYQWKNIADHSIQQLNKYYGDK
ncbi:glycosyltransferase [Vagococcus zengguangii]|uniref:Glycosyltransferase n=1 Tax=Vagococcus zengguangii TaxID=2571750 RepID=A0A4D7CUR4_9ENTE|nr:glycosyltransferase [Vagococcus zengguangii]QCI87014.1 glycosyltransferase [Vagococcus zengguangii]